MQATGGLRLDDLNLALRELKRTRPGIQEVEDQKRKTQPLFQYQIDQVEAAAEWKDDQGIRDLLTAALRQVRETGYTLADRVSTQSTNEVEDFYERTTYTSTGKRTPEDQRTSEAQQVKERRRRIDLDIQDNMEGTEFMTMFSQGLGELRVHARDMDTVVSQAERTTSDDLRASLQVEIERLLARYESVTSNTKWNGVEMLTQQFAEGETGLLALLKERHMEDLSANNLGLADIDVSTAENVVRARKSVDSARERLDAANLRASTSNHALEDASKALATARDEVTDFDVRDARDLATLYASVREAQRSVRVRGPVVLEGRQLYLRASALANLF